eukprot:4653472-Amphidinium_carterae.2
MGHGVYNTSTASHEDCGEFALPGRFGLESGITSAIPSTVATTAALPIRDKRDAEIARLSGLVQDLLQEKSLSSGQAERVESYNSKKYEQEIANQCTSYTHHVAYLEGSFREALMRAQEASTVAQTEINKRSAIEQYADAQYRREMGIQEESTKKKSWQWRSKRELQESKSAKMSKPKQRCKEGRRT